MNDTAILYTKSPEDLILRVKAGDDEAAMEMGLICLTGLGIRQDLSQAGSYFAKAKQLGAKNADLFIAYIHECNDRMIKAIETYVGEENSNKKDNSVAKRIDSHLKAVCSERKKLPKILNDYGLPECPLYTSLNNLLEDFDSGRRSLTDISSIISLSDTDEQWCYDTAWLQFEEGNDGLASMWLKKSHPDPEDELSKILRNQSKERTIYNAEAIDIKGNSLLNKRLNIKILPEALFTSDGTIIKALSEWSRECNLRKQSYLEEQRHLEEERQRKIKEEQSKAEEEKRRAEEEARKRAEESTFIVGRYGRQRDEITDKTVSRQHCRVSLLDDGMVEIVNLSKSNGTVINGEKIEKVNASMDSVLKMGNYVIKIRDLFPPRKNPTEPDKQTTA